MDFKNFRWIYALTALLFCSSMPLDASHFRYGHVTWRVVDEDTRTVEFTVTTAWRSSFIGNPRIYFGDGASHFSNSVSTIFEGTDLAGESYTLRQYTVEHSYATEGPYTAYIIGCCRIWTVINAPSDYYIVETAVDLRNGNTGSPVSSLPVILQMTQGELNTVQIPAADPDGDSFTVRLATPQESGMDNIASAGTESIDIDNNGDLTWDTESTSVGDKYAAQVVIEENHAGNISKVALDFIIEIVDASETEPPTIADATSDLQVVTANQPLSLSMTVTDPQDEDITITAIGLPDGASILRGI